MSFHWTVAELAFAVPAGVVLGAAVSFFGQHFATKATTKSQRELAADERVWQKRAEIYPSIIQELELGKFAILRSDPERGSEELNEYFRTLYGQTIYISSWSSQGVRNFFDDYLAGVGALQEMLNIMIDRNLTRDPSFDKIQRLTIQLTNRFQNQLRGELHGDTSTYEGGGAKQFREVMKEDSGKA